MGQGCCAQGARGEGGVRCHMADYNLLLQSQLAREKLTLSKFGHVTPNIRGSFAGDSLVRTVHRHGAQRHQGCEIPAPQGTSAPYTLHPPPCTLHPTFYTLHPTPYILHPTPHPPILNGLWAMVLRVSQYYLIRAKKSFGRGSARAEDAQGPPTQSHIPPSIAVYEEKNKSFDTLG